MREKANKETHTQRKVFFIDEVPAVMVDDFLYFPDWLKENEDLVMVIQAHTHFG